MFVWISKNAEITKNQKRILNGLFIFLKKVTPAIIGITTVVWERVI